MIEEKRSEESNTNSPATNTDAVKSNAAVTNAVEPNSHAANSDAAIIDASSRAVKPKDRAGEKIASPVIRKTFTGRVRYWWSWTLAALMLLIIAPPVLLVAALAGRREWVYPFARFGAEAWLRLIGVRVRVRGLELLDPNETYIFISNHRSYLDTAALFRYVGKRRVGLLAKKELLKVPILGYGMGYVNVMAIDRSNHERALETVRAATEKIKSGVSFGVFAEGTRARPGELLPFKKGAFFMAIETGAPIVPVAMKNTDVLMGKGAGVLQSGAMEVVFMPPIETKNLTAEDVPMLVERVRNEIKRELQMPLSE
jgi:1-acyl-sn-glycerol-3-phosphate acyltransferase